MARPVEFALRISFLAVLLLFLALPGIARAQVVVFGESHFECHGVARSAAFSAQLQAMLGAKGLELTARNAGVSGDASAAMLARRNSAIPAGAKVVILDAGGESLNNRLRGVSETRGRADAATMTSRLQARGVIVIPESSLVIPMNPRQSDSVRSTAVGHRVVAERLVDPLMRALAGDSVAHASRRRI